MNDKPTAKTTAQLREEIDHGNAGDKVAFPDPAAAPLGTDAEAAGAPPTGDEIRTAFHREVIERPTPPAGVAAPEASNPTASAQRTRGIPIVIAVLVVVALAAFVLAAILR
ncbi:hypothetical protein DDE20_17690 [Pararhodobacter oceanensis]|uniref:Uncharacterized protein n=1 Tax=Pararhodobacter oceanensis TaxID=2172121 RepID=A0A2T8HQ94_9RHOB|nr:hypothetical protein DDE20_17690 [Pararhodobacter oceanensis]